MTLSAGYCGEVTPGRGLYRTERYPFGGCGVIFRCDVIEPCVLVRTPTHGDLLFHKGCAPEGVVPMFSRGLRDERERAALLAAGVTMGHARRQQAAGVLSLMENLERSLAEAKAARASLSPPADPA